MQNKDPFNSLKNRMMFKKRSHRPWKPDLLESTPDEAPKAQISTPSESPQPELDTLSADYIESKLKQALEQKTASETHVHEQLSTNAQNAIVIGGFLKPRNIVSPDEEEKSQKTNTLMNELKTQEQAILSLERDLKIARAIEQAEKVEISRKQEEIARKAAEEKALFAIQEAKKTAEKVYKIEQQLHVERRTRLEEEKARKHLEDQIQNALRELKSKEALIIQEQEARLNEEQLRRAAEENETQLKESMRLKEEELQKQAEEKINEALSQAASLEDKFQAEADEKIKCMKVQMETKINAVQREAKQKVEEAQEQAYFHEKAKLTAQSWTQKSIESARQIEKAKKELEKKLISVTSDVEEKYSATIRKLADEKLALEQKVEEFAQQIQKLEDEKKTVENNRALGAKLLSQSNDNVKRLEAIVDTEKELRKVMQRKLNDSQVKKEEAKRKRFEDKVMMLDKKLTEMDAEKSRLEEKLLQAQRSIRSLEIMKIVTE